MTILAINTASSQTGIALFEQRDNAELFLLSENFWLAQNNEAEKLMPAINDLFEKNGKTFDELRQVYVIKGPGSFTGLRVGITVANTIANLTNSQLFGLNTFEYWHNQSPLPVLVFAGKGGVYLSVEAKVEPEIVDLPDLNKKLSDKNIGKVIGDISDAQIQILQNVEFVRMEQSFGQVMQSIIARNLKNSTLESVKIIQPLYVKDPGITPSKKQIILK